MRAGNCCPIDRIDTDGGVAEDPSDPIEQAEVLAEVVSEVSTEAGTEALEAPAETTTDTVAEVPDAGARAVCDRF